MRRHEQQDPTGILWRVAPVGTLIIRSPTTPTNSQAGFAPGCLWINTGGTIGTLLYINSGTNTSSTWTNIA